MILAALIILAVVLFYALDRYVVVTDDGVSLEFPSKGDSQSAPDESAGGAVAATPSVTAELVVVDPDFDQVQTDAGEGLTPLKAVYIKAEDITAENLAGYSETMTESGAAALVLELKPSSGQLMWASQVELAYSYGTAGTLDISSAVQGWKDAGVYLVAQLSCCTDELMATRNPALALKSSAGSPYRDDDGRYWLDPYNRSVRDYIVALARELTAMGFDEILFSDLSHPVAEGLVYSQTMTAEPDPVSAVSSFALRLYNAFSETETKLSVLCGTNSLRNSLSAQTGEDLDFFFRVFDRVCCQTDSYNIETDKNAAVTHMSTGDAASRFVPVASYAPSLESWIIIPAGE